MYIIYPEQASIQMTEASSARGASFGPWPPQRAGKRTGSQGERRVLGGGGGGGGGWDCGGTVES